MRKPRKKKSKTLRRRVTSPANKKLRDKHAIFQAVNAKYQVAKAAHKAGLITSRQELDVYAERTRAEIEWEHAERDRTR